MCVVLLVNLLILSSLITLIWHKMMSLVNRWWRRLALWVTSLCSVMTEAHQQRAQFLHHDDFKDALQHYMRFTVYLLFNEHGDVEQCVCTNALKSATSALSTNNWLERKHCSRRDLTWRQLRTALTLSRSPAALTIYGAECAASRMLVSKIFTINLSYSVCVRNLHAWACKLLRCNLGKVKAVTNLMQMPPQTLHATVERVNSPYY